MVNFIKEQDKPVYKDIIKEIREREEEEEETNIQDELYKEAKELILTKGIASTSYLQRKLAIGYNRAL